MGLGAIPAGQLADRWGDIRVRVVGAVAFGCGIALLSAVRDNVGLLLVISIVLGVGGAVLLPTSLAILDRLHGGLLKPLLGGLYHRKLLASIHGGLLVSRD